MESRGATDEVSNNSSDFVHEARDSGTDTEERLYQLVVQVRNQQEQMLRQFSTDSSGHHGGQSLTGANEQGQSEDAPISERELECIRYGSNLLACSFFFGYLYLVLRSEDISYSSGLKKGLQLFKARKQEKQGVKVNVPLEKMFILCPSSAYIPPEFKEERMEVEDVVVVHRRNRAGCERRYQSRIYKLQPKPGSSLGNEPVYAVVEGAATLLTMYNTFESATGASIFPKDHKGKIVTFFFDKLRQLVADDPECRDSCEIIHYEDRDENGDPVSIADIVLEAIENNLTSKSKT